MLPNCFQTGASSCERTAIRVGCFCSDTLVEWVRFSTWEAYKR